MDILFVTGDFPSTTFILRMVSGLAMRGHQVTIMARQRGAWEGLEEFVPLPPTLVVRDLIPDYGFREARRLLRLLTRTPLHVLRAPKQTVRLWRKSRAISESRGEAMRMFVRHLPFLNVVRPDVVQFEFLVTGSMYPLLGGLLGCPEVVSCRGADLHLFELRQLAEQQRRISILQTATVVHCVSDEMAGEVRRIAGRQSDVWVNRPAVPLERIMPKHDYSIDGPPLVLSVGRLEWKKGHDYLLAALARLRRTGRLFSARIIGDGSLYSRMRFSIEDLGLSECVDLAGKLSSADVVAALSEADIFVLSSHEEGIANAVLEAMAAGLPIVTTDAGGMAEAVRDGVEGFVVPVRDIDALAERIEELLGDAALRERMGRAARARCESAFSLERQLDGFEQLYQHAVDTTSKQESR